MHLSNYLENKIVDWLLRGQSFSFPTTHYLALFSANPSDTGGGTEITGNNYSRTSIAASLSNWSGTQGAGTTVASSGTSGQVSNNVAVNLPVPGPSGWGTVTGMGLFDASSSGNLLMWGALTTNRSVAAGDDFFFSPGELILAITGGMSNYLKNKLFDRILRAQSFTPPTTVYLGATLDVGTAAVAGVEPTGNNYSRLAVTCSMTDWAGTQSAGSTSASSGTNGTTSNNATLTLATPSGSGWGVLQGAELFDAASAGNRLLWGALAANKSALNGQVVRFPAGNLSWQIDN